MKFINKFKALSFMTFLMTGGSTSICYAATTESQKDTYYKQYQSVIKDVNSGQSEKLQLLPFNQINDKDLVSPQVFQSTLTKMTEAQYTKLMATASLLSSDQIKTTFTHSKSKTIEITTGSSVEITCKLSGTYYFDKVTKRCYFGKMNAPTFSVSGGSWKNRGNTYTLLDSSRTVVVDIKGKTVVGENYSKNIDDSIEFHTTSDGYIK